MRTYVRNFVAVVGVIFFCNLAMSQIDTVPKGFRYLEGGITRDSVNSDEAVKSYINRMGCLPTDLQLASAGLVDYDQSAVYGGTVKSRVVFKKKICVTDSGRTPFLLFGVLGSSGIRARLISPSGIDKRLVYEASPLKANQVRIRVDFDFYGWTWGGSTGRNGVNDVRAEAGEWTLELSGSGKIDQLQWGAMSMFERLAPN